MKFSHLKMEHHPHKVTREKRKRKEMNKKKLQQAIESQTKAKSKIT
jgi:hypothetical protein